MKFFDQKDFEILKKNSNKSYDKNDNNDKELQKLLKDTICAKTEYWRKLLAKKLNKELNFESNYKKKPFLQAGQGKGLKFTNYTWAQFFDSKLGKKLLFTIGIDSSGFLILKIDLFRNCFKTKSEKLKVNAIDFFLSNNKNYSPLYLNEKDLQKKEWKNLNDNQKWSKLLDISKAYIKNNINIYNEIIDKFSLQKKTSNKTIENDLNTTIKKTNELNTILYGPPGTGKTYKTIKMAAEIVSENSIDDYDEAKKIFDHNYGEQIEFITFHENFAYEDFIQGIRPVLDDIDNSLKFEKKDGIFKVIVERAIKNIREVKEEIHKKDFEIILENFLSPIINNENEKITIKMQRTEFYITGISDTGKSILFDKKNAESKHTLSISSLKDMYNNENVHIKGGLNCYYTPLLEILLKKGKSEIKNAELKNYVLIIDEINRANISRVFGELITLLEKDKRMDGKLPLKCKLPSGEDFQIPSNLYIIGTMNTADKSIALLDVALRRRFNFIPMYPKYEDFDLNDEQFFISDGILEKINEEIIKEKGHDFQIGHSYFIIDKKGNEGIVDIMNNKVIPLLHEYFMDDKKTITKILDNAIKEQKLEIVKDSWPLQITSKN